jgi:hypothetical protein
MSKSSWAGDKIQPDRSLQQDQFLSLGLGFHIYKIKNSDSWVWWCTPLIPALGRQRQADFWVRGQPGLQSEFQDTQGYTEKPCLEKPKKKKKKRIIQTMELLVSLTNLWPQDPSLSDQQRWHRVARRATSCMPGTVPLYYPCAIMVSTSSPG